MEDWLIKNKHRLSIRAIEKEIGCPASTLSKVANGNIKLPGKWRKKLEKVAKDMEMFGRISDYVKVVKPNKEDEIIVEEESPTNPISPKRVFRVKGIISGTDPVEENNPPSKASPFDIPIEELKKKYNDGK